MRSMPVITTDIAGIPEMFEDGVHGFALPPDDLQQFVTALGKLGEAGAAGQRQRLQMGAAARKHAVGASHARLEPAPRADQERACPEAPRSHLPLISPPSRSETFTNAIMVTQYREAALSLSPPVVLVDMDGCIVDWDRGFATAWGGRSPITRSKSYAMEDCVPAEFRQRLLECTDRPRAKHCQRVAR